MLVLRGDIFDYLQVAGLGTPLPQGHPGRRAGVGTIIPFRIYVRIRNGRTFYTQLHCGMFFVFLAARHGLVSREQL